MGKTKTKFKSKNKSKSKLSLIVGISILTVGLFFTTKLVQKNQENRSKAAACVPKEGINTLKFDTSCGKDSYRYMTFSCYDGFGRREGTSRSCKSATIWKSYATNYCKGHFSKCEASLGIETTNPSWCSQAYKCDLDKDGKITKTDSSMVLDLTSGNKQATPEEKLNCDINKDGKISTIDALMILQIAGGIKCNQKPPIEPITVALNESAVSLNPNWKTQLDKVVNDLNSILLNNGFKRQFKIDEYFLYKDKEFGQLKYDTQKFSEYFKEVNGHPKLVFILLETNHTVDISQFPDLYGTDSIGTNATWSTLNGKDYPRIYQVSNKENSLLSDQYRVFNLNATIHELGHILGLGIPDWYLYEYSDCTNTEPKFSDYSIRQDPKFMEDPMTMGITAENINEIKFTDFNIAILNKNSNSQYDYSQKSADSSIFYSTKTKIHVIDDKNLPISNAQVKVYCVRKGCWFCKTQCNGVNYGTGVPDTSIPEQVLTTDSNGYVEINGPSNQWEMNEDKGPCIVKAVKAYSGSKSGLKTVSFIDVQRNYFINKNNVYTTDIVLK